MMPIELHGFMQDEKWGDDLGHVALGMVPIDLLWWVREWTTARLPWPLAGQWPPGDPQECWTVTRDHLEPPHMLTQLDRVSDSARDALGYAIGAQVRTLALVAWAVVGVS